MTKTTVPAAATDSTAQIAPESLAVGEQGERQQQEGSWSIEMALAEADVGRGYLDQDTCRDSTRALVALADAYVALRDAPAVGEQTVPALTSKEAADFAEFLDNAFVYLANHGWTTPVPEVIRGMQYLRALASAPEAAGQE